MVFLAIFSPDLVGFVQKRHHWWVGRSVAWSVRRWPFWALCVCLCECTCNEPATTTAHNCSTHTRTPAHTRTPNAMVLVAFRRRSVHLLSAPDPDAAPPAPNHQPPTPRLATPLTSSSPQPHPLADIHIQRARTRLQNKQDSA